MDRRRFVAIISGALAASLARAQQARTSGQPRRIAFLELGPESDIPVPQRPASVALRKLGWIEGENLIVERAHADLKAERLAALAEGLVRKRVEVIWANGTQAAIAAGRATQTIPIAFSNASWPVENGLIDSLARPGRNLTGTSLFDVVGVSTKRLEFLREILPAAKRLSRLGQPDLSETLAGGSFDMAAVWDAAEKRLGFATRVHKIRKVEDIDAALAEITAWRAQAINGSGGDYLYTARQRIAEFALRHRLPSVFANQFNVEAGGLLSYGPMPDERMVLFIRSLEYVDQILRGAQPGKLPVDRPRKYELLINMNTAKLLGLKIPQSILLRADRVIE